MQSELQVSYSNLFLSGKKTIFLFYVPIFQNSCMTCEVLRKCMTIFFLKIATELILWVMKCLIMQVYLLHDIKTSNHEKVMKLRKIFIETFLKRKLTQSILLAAIFLCLTGMSTSNFTSKAEQIPDLPKGNPDLSLGIVVRENSTALEVLADSSQNVRFRASTSFDDTFIDQLSSSSMVDRTPKKFTFMDEKFGFKSDNIYEFLMMFSRHNQKWEYIHFMPFCSVIEWVTEPKLQEYLDQWGKIFEEAGWERINCTTSPDSKGIQHFTLPLGDPNPPYCAWQTKEYKAVIFVRLRDNDDYSSYVPKKERKNIKEVPNGYIAFIKIHKKSQYIHLMNNMEMK